MMSQKEMPPNEDPSRAEADHKENMNTSENPDPQTSEAELRQEIEALQASLQLRDNLVEELKKKLAENESKISEIRDYVKRMESEIVAIRERAKRDQDRQIQTKLVEFFRPFLQLVDHLERSVDSAKDSTDPFVEGVRLIKKEFDETLKNSGLRKIEALDKVFDPNLHEAIGSESVDQSRDGLVTKELRVGYQLGDQVVRASQVIVGAKS